MGRKDDVMIEDVFLRHGGATLKRTVQMVLMKPTVMQVSGEFGGSSGILQVSYIKRSYDSTLIMKTDNCELTTSKTSM